jgi:hypothetical protein
MHLGRCPTHRRRYDSLHGSGPNTSANSANLYAHRPAVPFAFAPFTGNPLDCPPEDLCAYIPEISGSPYSLSHSLS